VCPPTTGAKSAYFRSFSAPAIDLIDGDALCLLLKDLKLGVRVRLVEEVEVDPTFSGTI
jgi:hypothetical protein